MRTTISIPDEFANKIKASLEKKGFNTLNEYVLNLIRVDQQQNGVSIRTEGQIAPFKHTPLHRRLINLTSVPTPEPGVLPIEEPNNDYPTSYLGKPLSGRKATCPVCYEEAPVEFANAHYAKKHGDI